MSRLLISIRRCSSASMMTELASDQFVARYGGSKVIGNACFRIHSIEKQFPRDSWISKLQLSIFPCI